MYTNAYFTHRGYNKATGLEEMQKLLLVVMICGAFASSFRIMGMRIPNLRRSKAPPVKIPAGKK